MKIEYIKLKNFRGYANETIINFNDLNVFVGKNDAGKSTILEALDIFFNEGKGLIKIDKHDVNVECRANGDLETIISVVFSDLPDEIVLDSTVATKLENEYLLNKEGFLEISKKYKNGGAEKVYIVANHPTHPKCSDLLLKTNPNLKKIIKEEEIECSNLSTNSIMRRDIWNKFKDDLDLDLIEIETSKADAKEIWGKLHNYLPVYSLFQADRANSDSDSEIQDPLKEAVKVILNEPTIQQTLNDVYEQVQDKLNEVAERTLDKLKEVDEEVADELNPVIPSSDKLKWNDVFKSVSISGDNDIPINKRGSGVKRLILLSFFRGEAERLAEEGGSSGIIYAIEEPETSQHTNNQKILIEAIKNMSSLPGVQVMITTHSANMVKQLEFKDLKIIKDHTEDECKVIYAEEKVLKYPSLNEVNYLAFNEITEEYLNELYGALQEIAAKEDNKFFTEKYFEEWLVEKGLEKNIPYIRVGKDGNTFEYNTVLPISVRNIIHHPENTNNSFTTEQLEKAIINLRSIYSNL